MMDDLPPNLDCDKLSCEQVHCASCGKGWNNYHDEKINTAMNDLHEDSCSSITRQTHNRKLLENSTHQHFTHLKDKGNK